MTNEKYLQILSRFGIKEKILSVEPLGNGHINDTLKVTVASGMPGYVLQRINHHIFTNVEMLQNNIHTVTSHIRAKLQERGEEDIDRKVLTFLPADDGKRYYFDGESYWRVCLMIPRSRSLEEVKPDALLAIFNRCCPICPKEHWAKQSRTFIIWNSGCSNFTKRFRRMQPDVRMR